MRKQPKGQLQKLVASCHARNIRECPMCAYHPVCFPPPPEPAKSVAMLALAAVPTHDDDWGSERQQEAENDLFDRLKEGGLDLLEDDEYLTYCNKATTVEQIAEAVRLWEIHIQEDTK